MKFSVGERIQKVRKEKGITQEELAEKIGVKRAAISKYESGSIELTVSMLDKIAAALGTDLNSILDRELFIGEYLPYVGYSGETISDEETELIKKYWKLNKKGKQKVADYIKDLCEIEEYTC